MRIFAAAKASIFCTGSKMSTINRYLVSSCTVLEDFSFNENDMRILFYENNLFFRYYI